MKGKRVSNVEQMLSEQTRIEAALNRAARLAVLTHAKLERAVPAARNGTVVQIPPQEIIARFGTVRELSTSRGDHP